MLRWRLCNTIVGQVLVVSSQRVQLGRHAQHPPRNVVCIYLVHINHCMSLVKLHGCVVKLMVCCNIHCQCLSMSLLCLWMMSYFRLSYPHTVLASSIYLRVSVFDTQVMCAEMTEPIQMAFGRHTCLGLRNHVLDMTVQIPPWDMSLSPLV